MTITNATWKTKYIGRLREINNGAADKMRGYLDKHIIVTLQDWNALIDYAYSVSTVYGEAAGALACEFYDAIARASNAAVPTAKPAPTATYQEVAKAIRGTGKSKNVDLMSNAIGRLVKMAGVDTTMQNALRDGAEWAWIPSGDTCAFCITLASRGWQKASKKAIKGGHAEHIHANCDCTYAVRFNLDTDVEGYNPSVYQDAYYLADGDSPDDRINYIRRNLYQENKSRINAQKRENYEARSVNEKTK